MDPDPVNRRRAAEGRGGFEVLHQSDAGRRPNAWKVVMAGNAAVGKTSLFQRMDKGVFVERMRSTVGIDMAKITVPEVGSDANHQINLWDTAGSERHSSITLSYYRDSVAVLLVFAADSKHSLTDLRNWITDAKMFAPTAYVFVVGNKWDLYSEDSVAGDELLSEEDIRQFITTHLPATDIKAFHRVSAKTGDGLEKLRQDLYTQLTQRENSITDGIKFEPVDNPLVSDAVLRLTDKPDSDDPLDSGRRCRAC